jgi:hypothetical protein
METSLDDFKKKYPGVQQIFSCKDTNNKSCALSGKLVYMDGMCTGCLYRGSTFGISTINPGSKIHIPNGNAVAIDDDQYTGWR